MDQGAVAGLAALLVAMTLPGCGLSREARLRKTLSSQVSGVIHLPSGLIEVSSELTLAPGAHDLEIVGDGTLIQASDRFVGRAVLVLDGVRNVKLHNFTIDGNRAKLAHPLEMAPPENAFRVWYPNNGILVDRSSGVDIWSAWFTQIVNFAILISRSQRTTMVDLHILHSGSKNVRGRNNLSGGILIEEGSHDFEVRSSRFEHILGNALWTHSNFHAPRQRAGIFARNWFDTIGRDAIQIGHATSIHVQENTGSNIGFPVDVVDIENQGIPVAIDTAGNVDETEYTGNMFEEINGQCVNLDGFHDGAVRDNRCWNRKTAADYPHGGFGMAMNNAHPETHSDNIEIRNNTIDGSKFGGLFLMGGGNRIIGNHFMNLNLAGCNESNGEFPCIYKADEPQMLESGIYLSAGASRPEPVRGNIVRENEISGYRMKTRCITLGPGVSRAANTIENNTCSDGSPTR